MDRLFFAYSCLLAKALLEIQPFDALSRERAHQKISSIFAAWQYSLKSLDPSASLDQEEIFDVAI